MDIDQKLNLVLENQQYLMRALAALCLDRPNTMNHSLLLTLQNLPVVQAMMEHEIFITEYGINRAEPELVRISHGHWPDWMERFKP